MLDRLAHGLREHKVRRIMLRLHLLPRRRATLLSLDIEGIGNVWVRGSRGTVGQVAVDRRGRGEEVLRVRALVLLLWWVSLGLVGRRGMGSRLLLVLLAGM